MPASVRSGQIDDVHIHYQGRDLDDDRYDFILVAITYASVYGDRWRVRSDRIVPEMRVQKTAGSVCLDYCLWSLA